MIPAVIGRFVRARKMREATSDRPLLVLNRLWFHSFDLFVDLSAT